MFLPVVISFILTENLQISLEAAIPRGLKPPQSAEQELTSFFLLFKHSSCFFKMHICIHSWCQNLGEAAKNATEMHLKPLASLCTGIMQNCAQHLHTPQKLIPYTRKKKKKSTLHSSYNFHATGQMM